MSYYAVLWDYYGYGNITYNQFRANSPSDALNMIMRNTNRNVNHPLYLFKDDTYIYVANNYRIINQFPMSNINVNSIINNYIFDIELVKKNMLQACTDITTDGIRNKYNGYINNLKDNYEPSEYITNLQLFKTFIEGDIIENINNIMHNINTNSGVPDLPTTISSKRNKILGHCSNIKQKIPNVVEANPDIEKDPIAVICKQIIDEIRAHNSESDKLKLDASNLETYNLYNYICVLINGYLKYTKNKIPGNIENILYKNIYFALRANSKQHTGYYPALQQSAMYRNRRRFSDTNEYRYYSDEIANTLLNFLIL